MTRKIGWAAAIAFAVFLVTWALGTFALDPENIGGRLGLYLLGIVAFLAGVVLAIIAIVRTFRARAAATQNR